MGARQAEEESLVVFLLATCNSLNTLDTFISARSGWRVKTTLEAVTKQ
ncbi:MAG: hypothetical protein ACJAXB_002879 [Candidatus Endobugula sp.]|jgi:hypothetical protein